MEMEDTLYQRVKKIPKKNKPITTICEITGFSNVWVWRVLKGEFKNESIEKTAIILIDNYNKSLQRIETLKQENNEVL